MSLGLESKGEVYINQISTNKCELAVVIRATKEWCMVIRGFYPARKEKEGISSRNGDGH